MFATINTARAGKGEIILHNGKVLYPNIANDISDCLEELLHNVEFNQLLKQGWVTLHKKDPYKKPQRKKLKTVSTNAIDNLSQL